VLSVAVAQPILTLRWLQPGPDDVVIGSSRKLRSPSMRHFVAWVVLFKLVSDLHMEDVFQSLTKPSNSQQRMQFKMP
jgi:hypothetical protein